jgi:hypothetical protein
MSERSQDDSSAADGAVAVTGAGTVARTALVTGLIGGLAAAAVLILVLRATGWLAQPDEALLARLEAAEGRALGVEQRLAAIEARPPPEPPPPVDLAPLRAELQQGLATAAEGVAKVEGSLSGLTSRLDGLAGELAELRGRAEALTAAGDELRGRVEAVARAADEQRAVLAGLAARADLEAAAGRLGAVEARLAALDDGVASRLGAVESEVSQRLAALEGEVGALRDQLVGVGRAATRVARGAMALVEMEAVLASGGSLQEPLVPLREVAADDAVLGGVVAELEPVAAEGVPTLAELRARLAALAPEPTPAAGGVAVGGPEWLGKTLENITGLVEVREVHTERAAVDAALDALDRGDLPAAIAAIEPLAQAGNGEAAAWVAAAGRRVAAETAVGRLRTHLAALVDPAR